MDLKISTSIDYDARDVLTAVGAIDLQSRHLLLSAAQPLLGGAATEPTNAEAGQGRAGATLVLDLAGITFIDSTGIGTLVELSRDAEEAGRQFVIARPSARVLRILQITGLQDQWIIEDES